MPRRLLLLGGGPAHAQLLAAFAREPLAGAELALLTPEPLLVQPALLPAFVAGRLGPHGAAAGCSVDTARLAAAAGATWVRGRVAGFDAATRAVTLGDGHGFDADLVSIDEPPGADRDTLPGTREHALALHPAGPFVALFDGLVAMAATRALDVVVVGDDAPAVELALALAERLGAGPAGSGAARAAHAARVALVAGEAGVLAGWPPAALKAAQAALARARITQFHEPLQALQPGTAVLRSGARLACDAALLATPSQAPAWLASSGLALAHGGLPAVDAQLQSPSHPAVFAPGPLGEHAAPALALQLRRAVGGAPLTPARVRAPWGRWLRLGRGRAVWVLGPAVLVGHAAGAACARRDLRPLDSLVASLPASLPGSAPATRSAGS
jgi:NADH dehydrogenase FAD-containing subunit